LSVVPGLNGVDVVVIANLVVCGEKLRRKVMSLLLVRLGNPSAWTVRAVTIGVTVAPHPAYEA
jgi:hypothetical protein